MSGILVRDLATCTLTATLSDFASNATVDDCTAFPTNTELRTSTIGCFAIISDGGVTGPDEIVRIGGRSSTTNLTFSHRSVNLTTAAGTWPIGTTITILNNDILFNVAGNMYSGYGIECIGSSASGTSDPGTGNCRFHGSATPSGATQFAIDDLIDGSWDIGPYLSQFVAGDLVRLKYYLVGGGALGGTPKMGPSPTLRIEFKIDTGGWTDQTGYWTCDIDTSFFNRHAGLVNTSDGVTGFCMFDIVKLV